MNTRHINQEQNTERTTKQRSENKTNRKAKQSFVMSVSETTAATHRDKEIE